MLTQGIRKLSLAYTESRSKGLRAVGKDAIHKIATIETYLAYRVDLHQPLPKLPVLLPISVRRADEEDFTRFRTMPYPFKRHAQFRDKFGIDQCYLALVKDQIANLCWIYYPHEQDRHPTPFRILRSDEAALANSVTLPQFRGMGVFPHMLQALCRKLRDEGYRYCYGYADAENMPSRMTVMETGFVLVGRSWRLRFFYHKDPAAGIYIRGRCPRPKH